MLASTSTVYTHLVKYKIFLISVKYILRALKKRAKKAKELKEGNMFKNLRYGKTRKILC